MLEFLIIAAVLLAVVAIVGWPLMRSDAPSEPATDVLQRDLEAAREAKYREIRDAEMDHLTGKLSDADYERVDGALRAEAVEILHELDNSAGQTDAKASKIG
jgi:hypothetical protein